MCIIRKPKNFSEYDLKTIRTKKRKKERPNIGPFSVCILTYFNQNRVAFVTVLSKVGIMTKERIFALKIEIAIVYQTFYDILKHLLDVSPP